MTPNELRYLATEVNRKTKKLASIYGFDSDGAFYSKAIPDLADAVLALVEENEALKEELALVHKALHAEHKRMREFLEKTQ